MALNGGDFSLFTHFFLIDFSVLVSVQVFKDRTGLLKNSFV